MEPESILNTQNNFDKEQIWKHHSSDLKYISKIQ